MIYCKIDARKFDVSLLFENVDFNEIKKAVEEYEFDFSDGFNNMRFYIKTQYIPENDFVAIEEFAAFSNGDFTKFNLKNKITTSIIILLIVNLIYFFDSYHEDDIILSSNIIIVGIDILFVLTNFFLLIFKRKGFYFIFFLLGLLFLVLPFFSIMMFALRGLPHG